VRLKGYEYVSILPQPLKKSAIPGLSQALKETQGKRTFLLLLGNVHWVTFIATASVIRQQFAMKIWVGSNLKNKHDGWVLSIYCSLFIPVRHTKLWVVGAKRYLNKEKQNNKIANCEKRRHTSNS
jgi:hypothetical protein